MYIKIIDMDNCSVCNKTKKECSGHDLVKCYKCNGTFLRKNMGIQMNIEEIKKANGNYN